jgi:hypothetical protein
MLKKSTARLPGKHTTQMGITKNNHISAGSQMKMKEVRYENEKIFPY